MKNIVLDASVVLEVLRPHPAGCQAGRELEEARRQGCRLWVVSAQLPLILLALERLSVQGGQDSTLITVAVWRARANDLLRRFLQDVSVLSSCGFQAGGVPEGADLESWLVLRAADSLGEHTWILTQGESLLGGDPRVHRFEDLPLLLAGSEGTGQLPFIDLKTQQMLLLPELEQRVREVFRHGQFILGPEIGELEARLARFTGARHAITCSSGTDALLLALMAHGVGPGDAVFTSPFTFVATAEAIALLGATPVFVDVDPRTCNLDPVRLGEAVRAVREKDPGRHPLPRVSWAGGGRLTARGIVVVDLFGLPADYLAINRLAASENLFVVEDAAQSFGALYHGRRACTLAQVGCTSFFPAKPLGGYGDGGAVFTDDDRLAEFLLSLRVHGQGTDKYDNVRIGLNARLDTLQAAVLLPKLEILPRELEARERVAARYTQLFSTLPSLTTPWVPAGLRSAWAQYSVLLDDRQRVMAGLQAQGIPTAIYYPRPLHLQHAFASLGYLEGDFPKAESVSKRVLSLPMHPYLEESDLQRVADGLRRALEGAG